MGEQGLKHFEAVVDDINRRGLAGGAKLDPASPRVAKIEITPQNPVVQQVGALVP